MNLIYYGMGIFTYVISSNFELFSLKYFAVIILSGILMGIVNFMEKK